MHLWDYKSAGIQIWDFWMFKMSDIGNHSESYTISSSVDTVIPKPTKPCVTLKMPIYKLLVCERCVYFAEQSIWVCTCVAPGNIQTCFDKIFPSKFWNWLQINSIRIHNNGIFPVIEFQVEVSYKMYFSDLGINQDEGIWKVRWGKRLWLICLRWRADQANV